MDLRYRNKITLWGLLILFPIGLFLNIKDYGGYLLCLFGILQSYSNIYGYVYGLPVLVPRDAFYPDLPEYRFIRNLTLFMSVLTAAVFLFCIMCTTSSKDKLITYDPIWNRVGKEEILFLNLPITSYRPPPEPKGFFGRFSVKEKRFID